MSWGKNLPISINQHIVLIWRMWFVPLYRYSPIYRGDIVRVTVVVSEFFIPSQVKSLGAVVIMTQSELDTDAVSKASRVKTSTPNGYPTCTYGYSKVPESCII